jgi:hypothetical protein
VRIVNEYKFYLAVSALLATLASAAFLCNDLIKHRTYLFWGRMSRREVIARDRKPVTYWITVGVFATSTLVVFACCPVLLIEAINGKNIEQNLLVELFIAMSGANIAIYLISSIFARLHPGPNGVGADELIELGLSKKGKQGESDEWQE